MDWYFQCIISCKPTKSS